MDINSGFGFPEPTLGEFDNFFGHKDKSSKIGLLTTKILRKTKERSKRKSEYELMSLAIWNRILKEYGCEELGIHSPIPYGMNEQGDIFMEYMNGTSTDLVLSGQCEEMTDLSKREVRLDFARGLGKLLRIKENEGLAHGDFQLRHLIQDINQRSLSVIDVENSEASHLLVKSEEERIRDQINGVYLSSGRLQRYFKKGIDEGYETLSSNPSQLGDITDDVVRDLGFPKSQRNSFMKNY